MFTNRRVLVVIPARGGSKGIPMKNIVPVAGKPLISYTTELIRELPWVDHAVVSTDSEEIAAVAQLAGTVEIVWRPEALAGDRVGDMPVLKHALEVAENETGQLFDILVMLQATSPLRTPSEVELCVDRLIKGSWRSVWTVCETDLSFHPQKQVRFNDGGALSFFIQAGQSIIARQQLAPSFHRNGVAYAFTTEFIKSSDSVFSEGTSSAVVTAPGHISIDTQKDIEAVEAALEGFQRKV